jgi:hypothetical protein
MKTHRRGQNTTSALARLVCSEPRDLQWGRGVGGYTCRHEVEARIVSRPFYLRQQHWMIAPIGHEGFDIPELEIRNYLRRASETYPSSSVPCVGFHLGDSSDSPSSMCLAHEGGRGRRGRERGVPEVPDRVSGLRGQSERDAGAEDHCGRAILR